MTLIGYELVSERSVAAQMILAQMLSSWQPSERWWRQQPGLNTSEASIMAAASTELVQYIAAALPNPGLGNAVGSAELEIVELEDESTGKSYELQVGPSYDWIDSEGNIVGTQISALPSGQNFIETLQQN